MDEPSPTVLLDSSSSRLLDPTCRLAVLPSRRLVMTDILPPAFIVSVLAAAVAAGTAILFACLGELITERAGVLNLGIEGIMLMGALSRGAGCLWRGNAWIGAGTALVAG